MTTIYYGYGNMPLNKIETLPFIDIEQAKTKLKILTSFNPNNRPEKRFSYTGTEINQILHQTPFLQRSYYEGLEMPVFNYYNRYQVIQPRPSYVANIDTSDASVRRLFDKEFGTRKN